MSRFTPSQQSVIDFSKNQNMVVSASAGSGKTTVMVERIINLICSGKASVNEILAVTFTKLASKEMKEKITKAILEKIAQGEKGLKYQLDLIQTSSISTVDSFCANLLRTYFYAINVDPLFSVLDEASALQIQQQAIEELFEELYEQKNEKLLNLVKIFLSRRSDKKLKNIVLSLYKFATSEKSVDEFLNKCLSFYSEKGVENAVNRLIDLYIQDVYGALDVLADYEKQAKKLNCTKLADFFALFSEHIYQAISKPTAKEISEFFASKKFVRPTIAEQKTNHLIDELIQSFTNFRKKSITEVFARFNSEFLTDLSLQKERSKNVYSLCEGLCFLVREFRDKYDLLKRDNCCLDYADLEHKTLQLLKNEEILKDVKETYKYIFVDEYQDTNGIQEEIFSLLENNNLFIVGDVKQSIYSFRGCNPQIFASKIKACEKGYGTHVSLDDNFRSATAVIDATNKVFSQIMKEKYSAVDYAKNPMVGGSLYGEFTGEAYYHVVDKQGEEEKNMGVYSVKKHFESLNAQKTDQTAKKVFEIIENEFGKPYFCVKEGRLKQIDYGDITILTRNNKGASDKIMEYLTSRGVPCVCQADRKIKEYPEISLMINLVEHVVNPVADIPLASVLKSEIGCITNGELSEIRQNHLSGSFYEAVNLYVEQKADELKNKLVSFFDYFDKIRLISQFESASVVLKKIVKERGLKNKILASSLGRIKWQRINRFILAGENLTISQFLVKLPSILENLTQGLTEGDNAVTIMSYHGSKGLEFPVVILADGSKAFNLQDKREEIYFNREYGIGLRFYDSENMLQFDTVQRKLLSTLIDYNVPTDEMRLLYVAMTRAKYKLHVIVDSKYMPVEKHVYKNYVLAKRFSDFLGVNDLPFYEDLQIPSFLKTDEVDEKRKVILSNPNPEIEEEIYKYLTFNYPYEIDTSLNLKRTVTSVAQEVSEGVVFEVEPLFNSEENISSAIEVGNAYHRFLQLANFEKNADNQLIDLLNQGKLTQNEADLLNVEKLNAIMNMDIFKGLKSGKFYREQPFILNVPARLIGVESNEEVLLQGIIDLLVIFGDKAFVIDYKYSMKSAEKLKQTYSKQLELYAYATEKISGLKVEKTYLINLAKAELIEV